MTKEQEIRKAIEEWVSSDLSLAGTISAALNSSLQASVRRARAAEVEWETIAMTTMETRIFNGQEGVLADRIERQVESGAFYRWDRIVAGLRKKRAAKISKAS